MKIKKILACLLSAAMLGSGAVVLADPVPEKTWTFDGITEKPSEFTDNAKALPAIFSHAGADGSGNAFGFTCGVGVGKGSKTVTETSNGYRIAVTDFSEVTDGVLNFSYDFMVENQNVCAWLIAPTFGTDRNRDEQVTLENGVVSFRGTTIGEIEANEWHTVGAQYNVKADGTTMKLYFDGVAVGEDYVMQEFAKNQIQDFSILVNPDTTMEQLQANMRYDGRKENFYMDNLYIGQDPNYFKGVFKVNQVAQGTQLYELVVSFNRAAENLGNSVFTVSGMTVSSVRWENEGKNAVLVLNEAMTPGTDYTVTISSDISADDGTAFSGQDSFTVRASYSKTVNMEWTFDDKVIPPKYFTYNNKQNLPTAMVDGITGKANDYAFMYLIGIGGGAPNGDMNKYTEGFRILQNVLGFQINDVTFAYDMDFMVKQKHMIGHLFAPNYGASYNPFRPVMLIEGVISVGGVDLAEIEANEWHNIGVRYTKSSVDGITADIYLDGVKLYTDTDNSATAKGGIDYFNLLFTSKTYEGDPGRFDARNEYLVIDNLYIGDDLSRLISNLKPVSSTPADGAEEVDIDTPISVTFNDTIANDDLSSTMKLSSALGEKSLSEITKSADEYTLSATYDGTLNYRDTYTISFDSALESGFGKALAKSSKITFRTKDYYPNRLEVSNFTKTNGIASANISLSGTADDKTLIMAAYDKVSGAMTAASEKAFQNGTTDMQVACTENEIVKIFCIDSISAGNLLAAPYIEADTADGYDMNTASLALSDAECNQCVITVPGTSSMKKGYVLTKIAGDKKAIDSANLADYLTIDAVRTDANGKFTFAGRADAVEGRYLYTAKAENAQVSGSTDYKILDGCEILSMNLGGRDASVSSGSIRLTTTEKDISGLLAKFTLSEKATLYLDGKLLESGKSRINCNDTVTLVCRSEFGTEKTYTLTVTKKKTESGGGGGGGNSSSSGISMTIPSGTQTSYTPIAAPIEEISTRFDDVPKTHWAYAAIEALSEEEIVAGSGEKTFEPERGITREEFCTLLQRVFAFKSKDARISFDDIPTDAWYQEAVYILAENGIVSGLDTHTFGVGEKITRQDMAVLIARCLANKTLEEKRDYAEFSDEEAIANYAKEAVQKLYCAEIINGMGDGTFQPMGSATRAQAAVILNLIR